MALRVAAVAAILAAGLIISFYWPAGQGASPEIVLPQSGSAGIEVDVGREQYNQRLVEEIAVDRSTVQRVVATLSRPGQYTFTGESTYYYDDASSVFSVRGAVRGRMTKVVQSLPDGIYKHTILTPHEVYIWSSDSLSYYKGEPGGVSADELALMPTYEELLDVPAGEITAGGFAEVNGQPCVYAERTDPETGARDCYIISIETGLLVAFGSYLDEQPLFTVSVTPAAEAVGDDWFTLPSGVIVTETPSS